MRVSSAVSIGLAILLGGTAAYLSKGLIQSQRANSVAVSRTSTAVVAAQSLVFGAALTAENLREIPWPSENVPEGSFRTIDEFLKGGRRVALSSFQRDEPILSHKVTGPNQRATLSTLIEEGMRAVSVRVDEVRGVAGFILPGDRVDVVLTRGERGSSTASADVIIQNTKVLAIDQIADDQRAKPTVAKAVTLELDMQQAQKVILAEGIGRLSLVLRQAGEANSEPTRRVLVSDLGVSEVADGGRKEKGQQIAQVDARAVDDAEKPVAKEVARLVPARQPMVNVIRNAVKREQYTVHSEIPQQRIASAKTEEAIK